MIKKITFSLLLLSALTNNNVTAMQNIEEIIPLIIPLSDALLKKEERPFLIINHVKHYAYPHPNDYRYQSNPALFSQVFMHTLAKNLDWRKQNGYSDYERTHYQNAQIKFFLKELGQIHQIPTAMDL